MTKRMSVRAYEVRDWTVRKQWRGPEAPARTFGDDIALLHSEVSEAIEAFRLHGLKRWFVLDRTSSPVFLLNEEIDYRGFKPEGVGSELADVLIRLLDNYMEWNITVPEPDYSEIYSDESTYESFGDAMAKLHAEITSAYDCYRAYIDMSERLKKELVAERFNFILIELLTISRHFGIAINNEYEAKMTYNQTREIRHGGKKL